MSKSWRAVEPFVQKIQGLMKKTQLFPGKKVHVDLVVNPKAGAFTHYFLKKRLLFQLEKISANYAEFPDHELVFNTYLTKFPGHEKEVLGHLLRGDPMDSSTEVRIVLVAGGDGTSKGVFAAFQALSEDTRDHSYLFRLPLGTGNDAADAPDLEGAFKALVINGKPQKTLSVRMTAKGLPQNTGFNISSIGMDAFVVVLTNAFKKIMPGNSYSLMVDVATLFYEPLVKLKAGTLTVRHQGRVTQTFDKPILLAALGAGGHRVYGSGKKVLPGDENLCWAEKQKLFTKLSYIKPFYNGTHGTLPGIHLVPCDSFTVDYPGRLPVQLDGESFWLEKENFPVTFEVLDSGLTILR